MPAEIDPDAGARPSIPRLNLPEIHTLWVGSQLGPLERLALASWVKQGHPVMLHAYDDLEAPAGVRVVDAGRLCPRETVFRHHKTGSLALFADYFRLLIMQAYDALWMDTDVVLVRPFWPPQGDFLVCEGNDAVLGINLSVFRLTARGPLLHALIANFDHPWRVLARQPVRKIWPSLVGAARRGRLTPGDLPWGAFAYGFVHQHIARHGFDGVVLGPETCLTPARAPLFLAVPDPDALLAPPVIYLHLYRSHQTADLAHPVRGSVYARLWEMVGLDPG